jgi:hypothetical protein
MSVAQIVAVAIVEGQARESSLAGSMRQPLMHFIQRYQFDPSAADSPDGVL